MAKSGKKASGAAATKAAANKARRDKRAAAKAAANTTATDPGVDGIGGGLVPELKPSGTRATPRKEQPSVPERSEIVEARRLEQEQQKSIQKEQQKKANPHGLAVGDRVRIHRNAATNWEMGTITHLAEDAAAGTAVLDGGETVGLEPGRWEPASGVLAQPEVGEPAVAGGSA